jgi:hypothetical protein
MISRAKCSLLLATSALLGVLGSGWTTQASASVPAVTASKTEADSLRPASISPATGVGRPRSPASSVSTLDAGSHGPLPTALLGTDRRERRCIRNPGGVVFSDDVLLVFNASGSDRPRHPNNHDLVGCGGRERALDTRDSPVGLHLWLELRGLRFVRPVGSALHYAKRFRPRGHGGLAPSPLAVVLDPCLAVHGRLPVRTSSSRCHRPLFCANFTR